MKNNGKKFLQGALVLAGANLLVKIIGALFKVPLYNLIGEDGSGVFNVAYQIYTFMFIIATAGFPIAVSKMVAESVAKGDEYDARRVFRTAALLLGVIGLVGSTVLYSFADHLAAFLGNKDSALGIRVISPAVFFVSLLYISVSSCFPHGCKMTVRYSSLRPQFPLVCLGYLGSLVCL